MGMMSSLRDPSGGVGALATLRVNGVTVPALPAVPAQPAPDDLRDIEPARTRRITFAMGMSGAHPTHATAHAHGEGDPTSPCWLDVAQVVGCWLRGDRRQRRYGDAVYPEGRQGPDTPRRVAQRAHHPHASAVDRAGLPRG